MRLTIVRHAYAGQKRLWQGDDLARPLADRGRQQAAALAKQIRRHGVSRVLSSPALRCIQTVEPIAEKADVAVEMWDELGPSGDVTTITACFSDGSFDDAVLCTHGEVMGVLLHLDDIRREMRRHKLSKASVMAKGSALRLHLDGAGGVTDLKHIAVPE